MTTVTRTPVTHETIMCAASTFVTLSVQTANSSYVLVKRSGFVTLVKTAETRPNALGMRVGEAHTVDGGMAFLVHTGKGTLGDRIILRVHKSDGSLAFQSTEVTHAHVLEN